MRPEELSNTLRGKKARGQKAAQKVARRIAGDRGAAISHDEVVALYCVPLTDEERAKREIFQQTLSNFRPSLSFYYGDIEKITEKQRVFLSAFGESGIVRDACAAAKVSRRELQRWLEEDEPFRVAYEDTEEDATDDLESVAIERAKQASDQLLMLLLKAKRPQKYVERAQVDVTKRNGPKEKKQVWEIGGMRLEF